MHSDNKDDLKLCVEELRKVSETLLVQGEEGFGEFPNLPFSDVF